MSERESLLLVEGCVIPYVDCNVHLWLKTEEVLKNIEHCSLMSVNNLSSASSRWGVISVGDDADRKPCRTHTDRKPSSQAPSAAFE